MQFAGGEEKNIEEFVKSLNQLGINVVVTGGKLGDLHVHFLNKYKMLGVKVGSKFDLRRLCRSIGAVAIPTLRTPAIEEVGECDEVYIDEIGSDELAFFKQNLTAGHIATIIIRGSSANVMDDTERAIIDGINNFRILTRDNRLLAGGGAVEFELARQIEKYGALCPGMEQYSINKFAVSMEVLPKQLADNSGAKSINLLSQLRTVHQDGKKTFGLNVTPEGTAVADMVPLGIYDPYLTKYWMIKLATNLAVTLLSVDQIIMAKQAEGPLPKTPGKLDPGRTANILGVRKHCRTIGKKDRKNQRKQLRSLKQEQANERKGTRNHVRPPVVVCILSLSRSISPKNILSRLVQGRYKDHIAESERGLTFLRLPERKSRFCFLCPDAVNMLDVLDSLKVADIVLFVWNGQDYQLSDYLLPLLSSILAQGLPSFFNVLINPFENNVNYEQEKRCLAAMADKWGLQGRFYKLDTAQEQDALLRLMSSCSTKPLSMQEHRTRLLVESCTIAESNSEVVLNLQRNVVSLKRCCILCQTGLCTLRLCGYVRGPSLDVNRLVHIPGWGDYQLSSVDVLLDPHPLHEFQKFTVSGFRNFAVANPECQEKLYSEIVVDKLDLEEAEPITEAELQLKGNDSTEHPKHFFPKGTSEYQATWMMDIPEYGESIPDTENVLTISTDGTNDEACNSEVGSLESSYNVEMLDYEEMDTDCVSNKQDVATDWRVPPSARHEHKLFPDEIDTPAHEPARIRFQKYRSLKSFRTSFWDPKENLPHDYVRIVQFKNFSVTKKRILEQEVKGAVDGWYVAIYVKSVKMECAGCKSSLIADYCADAVANPVLVLCNSSHPLVVYSLLPNEQKMALLNVLLRKHAFCDQPIRSKDELLFHIGYRRYFVSPVFSQHTNGDKHKVERFLPGNATVVASFFAPVMFPPAGVSVFKLSTNGQLSLVGTGSLMNVDADRVILKRVVLSGHPYKINRRHAVVRNMFFNRGKISQAVSNHGHFVLM
ncbi:AARP2CN domain protein [Trichuris suis]|nr:AARP2CN domain protein [Trichuris suis]